MTKIYEKYLHDVGCLLMKVYRKSYFILDYLIFQCPPPPNNSLSSRSRLILKILTNLLFLTDQFCDIYT